MTLKNRGIAMLREFVGRHGHIYGWRSRDISGEGSFSTRVSIKDAIGWHTIDLPDLSVDEVSQEICSHEASRAQAAARVAAAPSEHARGKTRGYGCIPMCELEAC